METEGSPFFCTASLYFVSALVAFPPSFPRPPPPPLRITAPPPLICEKEKEGRREGEKQRSKEGARERGGEGERRDPSESNYADLPSLLPLSSFGVASASKTQAGREKRAIRSKTLLASLYLHTSPLPSTLLLSLTFSARNVPHVHSLFSPQPLPQAST